MDNRARAPSLAYSLFHNIHAAIRLGCLTELVAARSMRKRSTAKGSMMTGRRGAPGRALLGLVRDFLRDRPFVCCLNECPVVDQGFSRFLSF